MSAIVKACNVVNTPKNTGKECDTAMVATAMIIAMQSGLKFDDTDLEDPVGWLTDLIHQKKAFPLFGQKAPIREITNDTEGDQIVTLDDGLKVFLRYGLYNRTFATTAGGLCYAAALQSFLNSGFDVIEIDQLGQMLARKNSDKTYSPLITDFMYSPAPIMADFKATPYKNRFSYSYSPTELVQNGVIFKGASALLSMMGLLDVEFKEAKVSTATNIFLKVVTECAGTDLVTKFPTHIITAGNFIVKKLSDGSNVVVTATVDTDPTVVKLAGTFTSATVYRITGASPEVWQTNGMEGYDASVESLDVTIGTFGGFSALRKNKPTPGEPTEEKAAPANAKEGKK